MGSGASSLPERLDKTEVKTLCGEDYDTVVYSTLQNKEGVVERDRFLSLSSDRAEREVFQLYRSYATSDGRINQGSFVDLCRDTKLLHKNSGFSSSQSSVTFDDVVHAEDDADPKSGKFVNYQSFRFELLPVVADKKGMAVEDLVRKLSRVDVEHTHKACVPSKYGLLRADSQAAAQLSLLMGEDEEDNAALQVKWEAAVKLQRLERIRIARRRRRDLAEVKQSSEMLDPQRDFHPPIDESTGSEQQLQQLFAANSKHKEMSMCMFLAFCKDQGVLCRTFTRMDARLVFDKSKAMALSPLSGASYNAQVFFDKRISYMVFREIALPCLAQHKGVSLEELIESITMS
jgi:hypothetical protein